MIAGFKFFIEETDILIAALTGDLFDGQVCIDQKGCCPGEFFCLDDLLKGLAGVCRPGQNDPAWMPESCWKIWQRCKERRKNEILFVGKSKYNTGKISEEQKGEDQVWEK